MHLLPTLKLAALFLGTCTLSTASPAQGAKHLETRALPPCEPCPNGDDKAWRDQFEYSNPGAAEDFGTTYPKGWMPKAASKHGWTCYE
jgi:hypothetical protein